MFEHLTFTLAQADGAAPPPPPSSTPNAAPVAPSGTPAAQAPSLQANPAGATPAQNAAPTTGADGKPLPAATQSKPFADPLMLVALAVLAFMFFFTINSSRKEKKKRAALASSLKKGAKVRTIGGIIGTVAEVRDDNTVVIKVDENANTRLKFDRSAVAAVLEDKAD